MRWQTAAAGSAHTTGTQGMSGAVDFSRWLGQSLGDAPARNDEGDERAKRRKGRRGDTAKRKCRLQMVAVCAVNRRHGKMTAWE